MKQVLGEQISRWVKEHQQEYFADLAKIVGIYSVREAALENTPYGKGCAKALDTALELAQSYGLHSQNADGYYGTVSLGSKEHRIGILAHLDVVPAGSSWTYPPFTLTLEDGYAIGRGVEDNKGPAIAALYAMRCINELKIQPNHGVMLFLGCCEESGMEDIAQFLMRETPPDFSFTPDARYPVCYAEKGIFEADIHLPWESGTIVEVGGGVAGNVVAGTAYARLGAEFSEKLQAAAQDYPDITVLEKGNGICVQAAGISSHASQPEGSKNAILTLVDFLLGSKLVTGLQQSTLLFIQQVLSDHYGRGLGIADDSETYGRLTCIGGMIETTEDSLILKINIRYPVSTDSVKVEEKIRSICAFQNGQLEIILNSKPHYFDPQHPVVKELTRISNEVLGRKDVPYVMGGGTYARKMPNAVAFGVAKQDSILPPERGYGTIHQQNEAIMADTLLQSIEIMVLALLAIDAVIE